ncbi:MAG: hypothetical protein KDH92_11635 [Chloroflexi bacterium]|nr:hypothetical protein [Chloroflexota bacterium]
MTQVLITAAALATDDDWPTRLQELLVGGLGPMVVGRLAEAAEGRLERSIPRLAAPETLPGASLSPELLVQALSQLPGSPSEAFLVCEDLNAHQQAESLGCRSILVLGDRSLDQALGPGEPGSKSIATAPSLDEALRYVIEEHRQSELLGPFPYGPAHPVEERPNVSLPTASDLAKIFGLSVVAGVAVALGIAYLLQEVYQSVRFPRFFYYLTLQFIPQTLRGLMFLLLGAGAGLLLPRLLSGLVRQRRSYP